MKKTLKRLLSLIIATFLILSFSIVPTFATESDPIEWTLTTEDARPTLKTISASNINETGVTVTAYQIVKGTYKDGKLTGYTLCDGLSSIPNINSFDYVSPTSDWITKIANDIEEHPTDFDSVQMVKGSGYPTRYTSTVEAGEYIILVTKPNLFTIYNPAIVSVKVTDANLLSSRGNDVDMSSQFSAGDTAYMKSSSASIIKKVSDSTGSYTTNPNTASFGKAVEFEVSSLIPSYSSDYKTIEFVITDDLYLDDSTDPPFLGINDLKVYLYPYGQNRVLLQPVTGAVTNYSLSYYDENGNEIENQTAENLKHAVKYKIEFADSFIRANPSIGNGLHGKKYIEVRYSTTVTENAKLAISDYSHKFASNDTRATLRYSNDPTDDPNNETPYYETTDSTKTYTFGIDSGNGSIQTYELNKVTQAGGTYTSVVDNNDVEITKKSPNALAGATFTLYSDSAMNQDDIIGTATSDANGHIEFRGLGEGTYYLKETAAPSNYTLNANNYKIVITYSSSPSSYTITTYLMGETDTQIGSARYSEGFSSVTPTVTPAEIVNTTLATLPTTGGIGTIVISVIAGLGMAVFLTVFVICKKRSSKKN